MKKLTYITLVVALVCGAPLPVHAETIPASTAAHVLISEIQTGGTSDATEEFVELYNPRGEAVDVTGWLLQYRAASGLSSQSWAASTTKATLACVAGSPTGCRVIINPNARLVLTHTLANIAGALPMTGGFSGTGGQIRLVEPGTTPIVHDLIGYGTAADFEGAAAAAPTGGKSIKRVVSALAEPQDTNNNAQDFIASCGEPSPGVDDVNPVPFATGCAVPPVQTPTEPDPPTTPGTPTPETPSNPDPTPETPTPENPDTPGETTTTPESPAETPEIPATPTYLPLDLTEIFPDPASPQQDSVNEFIEIYNPHPTTISLAGYQLQTGTDYRYHYTLGDTPLGPQSYSVITSAVSKLSLTNSGSGVRLLDPSGTVVAEVPNYGDAKEGQSWMKTDTSWQWTLTPTPGSANALSVVAPKITAATTTPSTTKKTATTKSTTPSATAPKTAKATAAKTTDNPSPPEETAAAIQQPPYWIIAPLSACILGYAIYEYRQPIAKAWRNLVNRSGSAKQLNPDDAE